MGAVLGTAAALVLGAGCETDLELGPSSLADAGIDASSSEGGAGESGRSDAGASADASGADGNPTLGDALDPQTDLCLHLEVLNFNRSDDSWSTGQSISRFSGYAGELLVHQDELLAVTNAHVWVVKVEPIELLETREDESFTEVQFVDLTGDDQDEAITSGQQVTVFSVESDGWHRAATLSAPEQANSVAAAIADFDEDGNVDIASLSGAGHVLHLGDGSLEFSSIHLPSEFPLNSIHVYAAQAADVDLDEHMDIVFYATAAVYKQGAEHDASLFVFRGDGSGRFSPTTRTRLPAPELSGVGQRL
ncbi:MAG TPA: VCBS repeat-containing protein, partial [Polyangiaceae bacterium]|nr:VCBS repeat-containing protein [Polyangiaceae bacterium]